MSASENLTSSANSASDSPSELSPNAQSLLRKNASRLVFVQAIYGEHLEVPIDSAENWVEQYQADKEMQTEVNRVEEDEQSDEVFLLQPENDVDRRFLKKLLKNWVLVRSEINKQLMAHFEDKKRGFKRLSPLIQSLLSASYCELTVLNTKKPVVMKEYMQIAAAYFDNPELGFINGSLQELADAAELMPKPDSL